MKDVLLAKLDQTESVTLPTGIVRAPEDAELTSGANGFWFTATRSGGIPDSCDD
jgi:hypothetical protein